MFEPCRYMSAFVRLTFAPSGGQMCFERKARLRVRGEDARN